MLRRLAASAAVALIIAAPATSSAQSCRTMAGNLIQNCSFELGVVNPGADYPNAVVSNWTTTFAPQGGTFERWTNGFDGFASRDGNSHLELQVNGPTNIAQSFITTAGQSYSLGFSSAHRARLERIQPDRRVPEQQPADLHGADHDCLSVAGFHEELCWKRQ